MSVQIPDLWSDDISANVVTPLAILRAQIPGLERRTKGLIEAQVYTDETDKYFIHNFDLVVPALGRFRERILIAKHEKARVYPVTLEAAWFRRKQLQDEKPRSVSATFLRNVEDTSVRNADSQEDFISLVSEVLKSPDVRSSIQSLIARSNEIRAVIAPEAENAAPLGHSGGDNQES